MQGATLGTRPARPVNYLDPPVVEVAVLVQFEPPERFNIAHLGAFWQTQKGRFQKVVAAPPIAGFAEDEIGADGRWLPSSLRFAISNEPQCRLQMTGDDEQWMRQVQPDRLVVNWRKKSGGYPRFDAVLDEFLLTWREFDTFLRSENLAEAVPRLWEVVYVNRIPKGPLWQTPSDWPAIFPGLWGRPFGAASGLTLRGTHGRWMWDDEHDSARLDVDAAPAMSDTADEVFILGLTGRGRIIERRVSSSQFAPGWKLVTR